MTDPVGTPALSDSPYGNLPPGDPRLLKDAPLEVAICEVRFTGPGNAIPAEAVTRIRDALASALGIEFPNIQIATQGTMQINFSVGASNWAGDQIQGWQIASADGKHSATIFPGTLIWQVGAYRRWSESMRQPIEVLLGALEGELRPELVQRVGLRYVDRFVDPDRTTPGSWAGRIDSTLLGALSNPTFGQKVAGAQQMIQIYLDESRSGVLRHGPIPDPATGSINYLLDLDVSANESVAFELKSILTTAERLNRTSLSLFQACVHPDYLKTMQQEEVDD